MDNLRRMAFIDKFSKKLAKRMKNRSAAQIDLSKISSEVSCKLVFEPKKAF